MTLENFVYWLQGFVELNETSTITETQFVQIKNHLALVLTKKTPNVNPLLRPDISREKVESTPLFENSYLAPLSVFAEYC